MNILYVGAFRMPNCDAAAARVLNNARIMRACGHSVKFISWGGRMDDSHLCPDGKFRVDGFEYIVTGELPLAATIKDRVKAKLLAVRKTMSLIKAEETMPDVIVMYNANYKFSRCLIKFTCKNNIKLVNDLTEWYDNNELKGLDKLYNYLNMTRIQHQVKNKIVISSYLDHYYNTSHNVVLPPLCDGDEPKWDQTVNDERIPNFDGVTLIYAGSPAKKDNLHTVINVVNQLSKQGEKIRLIILGITKNAYISCYKSLLKDCDLHSNIIFLGRVSQDLVPAYYKKSDFMILLREPTRKNMAGFSTKFAESITAGIPIIANATSDIHCYIQNGKNGYILSGYDEESLMTILSDKILKLSRDQITEKKNYVKNYKSFFDCKSYTNSMGEFLDSLKL